MSPDKVVEFLKRELECIKRCNNRTCSGDCLDCNSSNSIDLMSLDSMVEAYQTAIEIIEKRKKEEEQERKKNRERVTPEEVLAILTAERQPYPQFKWGENIAYTPLEVYRILKRWGKIKTYNDYSELFDFVENMSSVTPQPKTGYWIEKDGYDGDTYYDCSECGESWAMIEGTPWNNGMNYCPNCGAKMEVSE